MPASPDFIESDPITFSRFSPDGRFVVTCTGNAYVRGRKGHANVWDASTGKQVFPPVMQQDIPSAVIAAFSPDSRLLATGVQKSSWIPGELTEVARIWDLPSGRPVSQPILHAGQIRSLGFNPDGRYLLTSANDRTLRIWDHSGTLVTQPIRHDHEDVLAIWSPDSKRIATASARTIRVWDTTSGSQLTQPMVCPAEIRELSFSPDGRFILVGIQNPMFLRHHEWLYLWDSSSGDLLSTPFLDEPLIQNAQFTPDGRCILISTGSHAIELWDLPPEKRPVSDLVLISQLLSNRQRVVEEGIGWSDLVTNGPSAATLCSTVPLPLERPASLWKALSAKYPDEFGLASPIELYQWHNRTALRNEADRDWFAAAFHYRWLLFSDPRNVRIQQKLALAEARAGHWAEAVGAHPELSSRIRPRPAATPGELIDLSRFYNVFLDENWNPGTSRNGTLAALPSGEQIFGGVKFDARGLIQLDGGIFRDSLAGHFPKQLSDIPIRQACHRLHFLHATVYGTAVGNKIGEFILHFKTGEAQTIPIIYGRDVLDWADTDDSLPAAWSHEGNQLSLRLYKTTCEIPTPGRAIESVDYRSTMTECAPFLAAISLEK